MDLIDGRLDPKDNQYATFEFTRMAGVLNSDFKYGHTGGSTAPTAPDSNIVVKILNPLISRKLY